MKKGDRPEEDEGNRHDGAILNERVDDDSEKYSDKEEWDA